MTYMEAEIFLKSGDELYISDDELAEGSFGIKMTVCTGTTFDVGRFDSAVLTIGIYDNDALLHNFDGARITPGLLKDIDDETNINIPLGVYYVDGTKTKRKKNVVMLTAYDSAVKFDAAIESSYRSTSFTAFSLLTAACKACGVELGTDEEYISALPNSGVSFTLASPSIQTWRDAVMWTVQLMCCNAVIDRYEKLTVRSARYTSESGGGSQIICDYESEGDDRVNVEYSDTRTYIRFLSSYAEGKPAEYDSGIATASDPQSRAGMFSLTKNPLMDDKNKTSCDTINEAWLEYMDTFATRAITAQMFSLPELSLGDVIKFKGGKVDIGRSVIGVVTSINWKYHGYTKVICAAPQAVKEEVTNAETES